jgi:hypothetical protein
LNATEHDTNINTMKTALLELQGLFAGGAVAGVALALAGAAISGGSINNTPIGATTPAAGSFTTLTASGDLVFGAAGAVTVKRSAGTDQVFYLAGAGIGTSSGGNIALYGADHATRPNEVAIRAGSAVQASFTTTGLNGCTIGATTPAVATVTSLTLGTDNYIYLKGSASVDGSVRMSYLTSADAVLYEKRVAGAWVAKHILEMT